MSAEDRDRQQRDLLRRLSDDATPGPWERHDSIHAETMATECGRGVFGVTLLPATGREDYGRADILFAIEAVNYVRAMLDEKTPPEVEDLDYCAVCGRHRDRPGVTGPGAPCMGCSRYPAYRDRDGADETDRVGLLAALLVAEYGEDVPAWIALRSARRIVRVLDADRDILVRRLRDLLEAPFDCRTVVDENSHAAVPAEHIRALLPEPGTPAHNHVTRDVKPRGQCPGCDHRRSDT